MEGYTADEISDILDLPKSTVYNILSDLRSAGYVESRRPNRHVGRPSKKDEEEETRTGKQKRIYVERILWGTYNFTGDFERYLVKEIDDIIDRSHIEEHFCVLADKIISTMEKKSDGKKFLPPKQSLHLC